ncbi:MAG TPA: hypothetical protein VN915_12310 [Elusimicrobiota bacterium]|nr:hypothetical protein [Elusimicrobiota bacterium]
MRKLTLAAALLVPAVLAAAAPARAADPALVAKIEPYLRDDEKAFLSAVLTRPELSAEFDAEAPLALKDPKNLTPFLGLWRGKIVQYAEVDSKLGYPNLDGKYSSFTQLMTPQQRAYMMRRIPTMKEDDRNSLIDYLKKVNDALAKYGELTWYTKKVVQGIMDHYKTDLTTYLQTPMAQTAKRDMPASAAQFAAIIKADQDARAAAARPAPAPAPAPAEVADAPAAKKPAVKPASKPAPKPSPATQPAVTPATGTDGSVATTKPSGGALDQARDAANHGAPVFDGGSPAKAPASGDAVVVPPASGTARPTLSPAAPGGEAGLVGSIPEVPSPAKTGSDMDDLMKLRSSKPAPTSWVQHAPTILGGLLGGLLGAVIGFLVAGPLGAVAGGVIGIGAGAAGGHLLGKKLFQ